MRVPAAGGAPEVFGTLGTGAVTQRWPQALPGGQSVLYTESAALDDFDNANLVIASLRGGAPKIVVHGGFGGRYVSNGPASASPSPVPIRHAGSPSRRASPSASRVRIGITSPVVQAFAIAQRCPGSIVVEIRSCSTCTSAVGPW